MVVIETIAVAFSMYSAIPMPHFEWNEKNMKYAMCAFPFVGLVIGAFEYLVFRLCIYLALPDLLRGSILCLLPVVISGGIHLDGYCDTCDALASHKEAAEKQKILKDPHIGSFAAIRLGVYLVFSFALCCSINGDGIIAVAMSFFISRCLSAVSVCNFRLSKDTGLVHAFASASDKKRSSFILIILLAVSSVGIVLAGGKAGIAALVAAALVFIYYYGISMHQFGGLSGDLAGWFLCKCELWMLASVIAAGYVGRII